MCKRESTEYDMDYVKKYYEDLNTTLIFVRRSSSILIDYLVPTGGSVLCRQFRLRHLQPDPNEQSAAFLRAILLTLSQSAIPGKIPTVPPTQEDPSNEIVTTTCLMHANLLISLLAAFVAMLGKQWFNRYLRNLSGSMIERCGDHQRRCDVLEKWPLHFFVESLPLML